MLVFDRHAIKLDVNEAVMITLYRGPKSPFYDKFSDKRQSNCGLLFLIAAFVSVTSNIHANHISFLKNKEAGMTMMMIMTMMMMTMMMMMMMMMMTTTTRMAVTILTTRLLAILRVVGMNEPRGS